MSSGQSFCRVGVVNRCLEVGAVAAGASEIASVAPEALDTYRHWVESGKRAQMHYLGRYADIRSNPALLLDNARTIIVAAFSYFTPDEPSQPSDRLRIARYALVDDYHVRLREAMGAVAQWIEQTVPGAKTRIAVDTAPLLERYWAVQSGLGFIGRNGQLIVPGIGSMVFLASIITDAALDDSNVKPQPMPLFAGCNGCTRCVDACPGNAIGSDGTVDASRCLSYLTIEHRDDFNPGTSLCGHFYGCDECLNSCPHNQAVISGKIKPRSIFSRRSRIASLTPDDISSMTPEEYAATFKNSPIKRAKLIQLKRNLRHL